MKTIQTVVAVEANGKASIRIPLLPELRPGEHAATLLIEESGIENVPHTLFLARYAAGFKRPESTLHREELYGDDGR